MKRFDTISYNDGQICCTYDIWKVSYVFRKSDTHLLVIIDGHEVHWAFQDKATCDNVFNALVDELKKMGE